MARHMRWSEALFGTGVPRVDSQHQELFARINALLDACSRAEGGKELGPTLDFLGEYVEKHFAEEEALMEARKCAGAAANKAAHDAFRKQYVKLRARLSECKDGTQAAALIQDVENTVCDWLTSHIMGVDLTLRETTG